VLSCCQARIVGQRGHLAVKPVLLMGERGPRPRHPGVAPGRWRAFRATGELQAVFRVFPKKVGSLHGLNLVTSGPKYNQGLPKVNTAGPGPRDPRLKEKMLAEELFASRLVDALG
jgi:hypothetical protein